MERLAGVIMVAILGGLLGAGLSLDLDVADRASQRQCADAGGFCVGSAPIVGFFVGVGLTVLTSALCAGVMAPKRMVSLTMAGILCTLFDIMIFLQVVRGGHLRPWPAFASVTASTFAVMAALASDREAVSKEIG